MDSTKSGLTEVLWKWVIWLSQFWVTMSKLTELMKRAGSSFQIVLAELCLILLFQGINLTLVTVEAVIV